VSQSLLTPKTIKVSGLPGGHYYDLTVKATVEDCFGGDCDAASETHVAYVTCDYRCKDRTCLQNANAR
jgi:hypothetical protein